MSDVNLIDSEDEGLAFGYSVSDEAEPTNMPAPEAAETTDEIEPAAQPESEPVPQPEPAPAPVDDDKDPMAIIKKLDGRLRNMQGEINKLNTQLTAQTHAAATAAAKEQGAEAPSASAVRAAMQDGEKLESLRNEFPEWAEALDEQSSRTEQRILDRMPKLDGYATKDEIVEFKKTLPVLIKHPTFEDDIKTPVFSDWFTSQGDDVKALAQSDSPKDAISLMDKFYERDKAPPSKPINQQERLKKTLAPDTSGGKAPARALSEDEAMSIGYKTA